MSALLSAIGCALLGLAVGAALQRWGDGERKLHGHKEPRNRVPADKELSLTEMRWHRAQEMESQSTLIDPYQWMAERGL